MMVLIVKSTESYHKGLQISIPILCSVTLKCHYWITNFSPYCNIILCWLPAWAEIWNCHPQTCKSDSTSLIRKVKLNIHSRAAFQVQTVWNSLRQNVFKLKHIFFLHFYAAKIQNEYLGCKKKNHKIVFYFELYTGWGIGFPAFCPSLIIPSWLHFSLMSRNQFAYVCNWHLLFHCSVAMSCSSINQLAKAHKFWRKLQFCLCLFCW